MSPLISIIVPVYNAENYVSECLESIIKQTYDNIEIIIVNDGSTDNSLHICQNYTLKDSRIKLLDQENLGQSAARNRALDIATGEYIAFVDSDDFIADIYINSLYLCIVKYNSNIAFTTLCEFKNSHSVFPDKNNEVNTYSIEQYMAMYVKRRVSVGACGSLFHISLVKNLRFNERISFEDWDYIYRLVNNANKVVYIRESLYFYRQRQDSTMSNARKNFGQKHYYSLKSILEEQEKFFSSKYPELMPIFIVSALDNIAYYYIVPNVSLKILNELKNYYDDCYNKFIEDGYSIPFKNKMFKRAPNLLKYIILIYKKLK
ncbi:glycosyltransferase like 2 family protein [Francisella philomiragia]|uniref:glycosyltransferase family 2 protein n=1 Tax=Francisella philomiragia TaxID=28110 RepID=UPI0005A58184|nr:glycosyltransferase [Francisella philomiragia]AJI56085.1 glycosyltransferase like 2 family protein [Francisella philomiragia]MBK2252133.1 glycosyltransferase [Francisella philomiragia]